MPDEAQFGQEYSTLHTHVYCKETPQDGYYEETGSELDWDDSEFDVLTEAQFL
jgi:hypothetical protein